MRRLLLVLSATAVFTPLTAAEEEEDGAAPMAEEKVEGLRLDWKLPVPGSAPITPGEHPRLVFRKADIPRLKQRAQTKEGQAILARMDQVLESKWSLWHGAAYGLKWTLTGDKQWADKAKECTDQAISGKPDKDGRYNFLRPGSGGPMRSGPAMGAVGLAYDLCYDAWEPAYRESVAKAIADNKWLEGIANRPPCGLGCNHFGSAVGGAGQAAVAIWGDPGIDQAKVDRLYKKLLEHELKEMQLGWSPYSYFYEGHQCGRISASGALPFLVAVRTAFAEDWLRSQRSNYSWMGVKWLADTVWTHKGVDPLAGGKDFDGGKLGYSNPQHGMYGRNLPRDGMVSQSGEFARAFMVSDPKYHGAMKWFYNRVLEQHEKKSYDMFDYPHFGIYALAYWPLDDVAEQNPAEVLPLVWADPGPGYFAFRNNYTTDDTGILVTCLFGHKPDSGRGMGKGGNVRVAGLGRQYMNFPGSFWCSKVTYQYAAKDGSGIVSGEFLTDGVRDGKYAKAKGAGLIVPGTSSLAVDFSGASGAPLLLAMTGPHLGLNTAYWTDLSKAQQVDGIMGAGKSGPQPGAAIGKISTHTVGGQVIAVMTYTKGEHATPKVEGDAIVVGKQQVSFDGKKLVLGTIAPAGPGMPKAP
jgi:hypothetical protein